MDDAKQATEWKRVVAARVKFMPAFHRQWSTLPWGSFTLFLLGMLAFRLRLFDRPEEHRRLIAALMLVGVASWAFSMWGLPLGGPPPQRPPANILSAAVTIARANAFMPC